MTEKNLISKDEVARLLGVSRRNIVTLVRRQSIPGPVRGVCPMPDLRKPRMEDTPMWDREAVMAAWRTP